MGGRADIIKILIDNGADIHSKNQFGNTALILGFLIGLIFLEV